MYGIVLLERGKEKIIQQEELKMTYYTKISKKGKCGIRSDVYRKFDVEKKADIRKHYKGTEYRIEYIWTVEELNNLKESAKERILKKAF